MSVPTTEAIARMMMMLIASFSEVKKFHTLSIGDSRAFLHHGNHLQAI